MSQVRLSRHPPLIRPAFVRRAHRVLWIDSIPLPKLSQALLHEYPPLRQAFHSSRLIHYHELVTKITASFCLLAAALSAQTSKTAIDNERVKVLQVVVEPHQKTRLHNHTVNRVMIYLQAGRQKFDFEDGKKAVLNWKSGEAKWSPAAGMHIAEITSDAPVTIVEIELKKPGSGKLAANALDPLNVGARYYKLEFENNQVRVFRVRIGAHQTTPLHEHTVNRVVTYLTDQNFRITSADGKPKHSEHKAGDVSWGGPGKHKEENLSGNPFEAVVVELK